MDALGAKLAVPNGARGKPETLARLPGREWLGAKDDRDEGRPLVLDAGRGGGAAISPLLGEGGFWLSDGLLVFGLGTEASLLVGDGGTWFSEMRLTLVLETEGVSLGLSISGSFPLTVLPLVLFLERTVTEDGM